MADDSLVLERTQELTWALLDEQITEDELELLDSLLLSDDAARRRYLECVQLHTDLVTHFSSAQPEKKSASFPPILNFLNSTNPGSQLPEDALQ